MNTTPPRTPRPILGLLLVSAVALAAAPARADDTARVFPLRATSPLPPPLEDAPAALTDALAELIGGVTTERALEDFGKKLRCDVEMSTCLDAVARALVTSRIVYGTLAAAPDGKLKVKLVRFDSARTGSEMHHRSLTLTARTPARLGKQLARSAAEMFELPVPEDVAPREPREPAPPARAPEEPRRVALDPAPADDDPAAGGRITRSTWGLLGGGALGAAAGAGFLISARGLRAELERAPRETTTDLRRLMAIERAGRIRSQIGGTLLVAGGAALAVGAVRAILQRGGGGGGGGDGESLERSVSLVPVEGGAALVFMGGLR